MPLHDWQCSTCGELLLDRYQPLLASDPPECPRAAEQPSVVLGVPILTAPHKMEILLSAGSTSAPFKEITVEVGQGEGTRTVSVTSLAALRRLERDSIAAWERGDPGAQPLIFKNFSDDHSNRDRSLFERHFGDRIRHPVEVDKSRFVSRPSGRRKVEIRAARLDPRELD